MREFILKCLCYIILSIRGIIVNILMLPIGEYGWDEEMCIIYQQTLIPVNDEDTMVTVLDYFCDYEMKPFCFLMQ